MGGTPGWRNILSCHFSIYTLPFCVYGPIQTRPLDRFWRTMTRATWFGSRKCFLWSLAKLRLGVLNPRKYPVLGPNAKIPVKSSHSNKFLTVRDRRSISKDHQYNILVKKSISDVIFGLRSPLAVGLRKPPLMHIEKPSITSERYKINKKVFWNYLGNRSRAIDFDVVSAFKRP